MRRSFLNRFWKSTLLVLFLVQIAALILATEQVAQAYVDPGTGLLALQILGATVAGWIYILRRRVRALFGGPRSIMPAPQKRQNAGATREGSDSKVRR
jgi:hypothetical protein